MIYERLLKLNKEELIRLIKTKDEQLNAVRKRMKNMEKVGKIFFKDNNYWVILEVIDE